MESENHKNGASPAKPQEQETNKSDICIKGRCKINYNNEKC